MTPGTAFPGMDGWDALPLPALSLSPEGELLAANRAFDAFCSRGGGESASQAWTRVLGPAAAPGLQAALAARADAAFEWHWLADGEAARPVRLVARWLAVHGAYLALLEDLGPLARQAQAAQEESQRLRLMADNVPVLIAYYQREGFTCRYANRQYASTFGLDPQSIVGRTFGEVIGVEAEAQIQPMVDRMLADRRTASYERQLQAPDGGLRWLHVDLLPHIDDDDALVGAFVLIHDITRYRAAEAALRESELRMSKFMQASVEGIVFHKDGLITDLNSPVEALVGFRREEVIGRHVFEFIPPEHLPRVEQVMTQEQEITYELELLSRGGERIPVEFIVRTMLRDGEHLRMTIVRDIRDRRAAQQRIQHLAQHDPLTGLRNRRSFMEKLEKRLAARGQRAVAMALLFIDLDHFKRINDSLGHLAGDTLLQAVAARITDSLRGTDLIGRFGGDEFVVLLPDIAGRRQVHDVGQKLLGAIGAPLELPGAVVSVTPSIGIALCPRDGRDPAELLRNADAAMYAAKAGGRAGARFFEPVMRAHTAGALAFDAQLQIALARREITLAWHPRRRVADGVPAGAQARLRWRHPERGWLGAEALATADGPSRATAEIAEWGLREVIRLAQLWRRLGLPALPLTLQLAPLRLQAAALADVLSGIEPCADLGLTLDLGDTVLGDDAGTRSRTWQRLRTLGLQVAVDDAGEAALPLNAIAAVDVHALHLGAALVAGLPDGDRPQATARALLGLGRALGRRTVALGVENEPQRRWLAEAGCEWMQGPLASPPLDAHDLGEWLRASATSSP